MRVLNCRHYPLVLLAAMTILACGPRAEGAELTDENLLTREAALARFQGAFDSVHQLSGGMPGRDSLVSAFVLALESRDTAALVSMSINGAEFAYLYYPDNPQSLPPYDLRPALMWQMTRTGSESGLTRLLSERAGIPLNVTGYSCDEAVSLQGSNTVTGPCLVQRRLPDGSIGEERLFGLILEREGQHKFVSYANSLD